MSKKEATPGPWTYNHVGDFVVGPDGKSIVCDAVGYADAQLISLAPEMASLLRELEWAGHTEVYALCPICTERPQPRGKGHAPACKLASLLAKIGEEP
jgi:hypothetical protein